MKIDQNTVVFITGAGSGFGLETAKEFASLGAKLILTDISWTQEAQDFIKSLHGDNYIEIKMDVQNEEQVQEAVQQGIKKFNNIHVLLNSAGVVTIGPFVNNKRGQMVENDVIQNIVGINVFGTINVSKYVAQEMIKKPNEDRVIINVGSIAGIEGGRGMFTYGLSKGAVHAITLPMARDLGKYGIRVVTFVPQIFKTPMGNLNNEGSSEAMRKQAALERLGDPREFSNAVMGVVTCSYLSGCLIRLDGGVRAPHL